MRENAETKAKRYLTEGRLIVTRVDDRAVDATCRGMGATYNVGYRRGGWSCQCPALGRCSHLIALQLVVDRPVTRPTEATPPQRGTR